MRNGNVILNLTTEQPSLHSTQRGDVRLLRQMLQRVSWKVRLRTQYWPAILICFILVGFIPFPGSICADTPIFKYEDNSGIITYTEQWDSIPSKYRERVITLDSATLKPVEGGSLPHRPHALQPIIGEDLKDAVRNSWRGRLEGLSIPLLSPFQLGIALASGVLIVGTLMVRRYTSNPFLRVLLTLVVVILVGGTGYLLYFLNLNAEVSTLTGESLRPTRTVNSLMQTLKNSSAPLSHAIENSVVPPIQSAVGQAEDATVGKAARAVNQSKAATTQMEKTLKETEVERAHVDGQ